MFEISVTCSVGNSILGPNKNPNDIVKFSGKTIDNKLISLYKRVVFYFVSNKRMLLSTKLR